MCEGDMKRGLKKNDGKKKRMEAVTNNDSNSSSTKLCSSNSSWKYIREVEPERALALLAVFYLLFRSYTFIVRTIQFSTAYFSSMHLPKILWIFFFSSEHQLSCHMLRKPKELGQ